MAAHRRFAEAETVRTSHRIVSASAFAQPRRRLLLGRRAGIDVDRGPVHRTLAEATNRVNATSEDFGLGLAPNQGRARCSADVQASILTVGRTKARTTRLRLPTATCRRRFAAGSTRKRASPTPVRCATRKHLGAAGSANREVRSPSRLFPRHLLHFISNVLCFRYRSATPTG